MDDVNEVSLTELVTETLQETTFDYSDVNEEEKEKLIRIKLRKGAVIHNTIVEIGGDLKEAQRIYSHCGTGKFEKWVVEEYNMAPQTARKYIRAYDVLAQNGSAYIRTLASGNDNLQTLGIEKLSSLSKLNPDQQKQVIENAPLNEMNKKQVDELIKKVKEAEEYSDELVEEIRKKDQKIRENRDSVEQKDKEIQELKSKIQELESGNMQPVAKVQEKIVEKVVEKEVVPAGVLQELDTYKKLAKENMDKIPEYIQDELSELRKVVIEKSELLEDAKKTVGEIAKQSNSKFGTQNVDWGLLGNVINNFLSSAGEYSYMKETFKIESGQTKSYVKTQVEKIEKWVLSMKEMMNENLMIGDTFYDITDFEKVEE